MNLKQLNTIGSGAYFPIQLEEVKDENGNVEMALQPDGTQVPKVRWGMLYGDVRLIKQNLIAILTFQIGQRFRQEYFGCRIWECIEEPNTQALAFLVKDFLKKAISTYETRITFKGLNMRLEGTKLFIEMNYVINQTGSQQVLGISYDRSENILKPY